ncbi:MAG: glycoside hydrolase family 2 TIM barrel-domain containing protein [Chthoniobacteraceae bacterium]
MKVNTIPKNRSWKFALDPADRGIAEERFKSPLTDSITLPGSLAVQEVGESPSVDTAWTGTIFDRSWFTAPAYAPYREAGNIKVPFFLQPEQVYVGVAWYQCEIEIPASWEGKRVQLMLERPHWQTMVWLGEHLIGSDDSLSTPHRYWLGESLSAGFHRLTIRVDNRLHIAVGENAHSVSDHTQGNWNGIVGEISLLAGESLDFEDLQITSKAEARSISVRGKLTRAVSETIGIEVAKQALSFSSAADGSFAFVISLPQEMPLWDEFSPVLHELTASLPNGTIRKVSFGLREIKVDGRKLLLNGRPLFLRGALECCIHPLTGHPPTDVESWKRILHAVQAHGFNHLRFHSWCPPEAAFVAGDELGVYFQVESAAWANAVAVLAFNSPAGIGDGNSVDEWVFRETERILREYGNHPCFILLSHGNEPGGPHHREYLQRWLSHARSLDDRRLFTAGAGWPELEESDYQVISEPRIHQWGDGLNCRINGQPPATTHDYREIISRRAAPVMAHENGQWCTYPPVYDTAKYRGHLKAKNYEIFAETLAANHLGEQVRDFVLASGKLQALCYKEEIESALRTPEMAGFQLLGLQDFSGQGTAPVGVLDAFWESKGAITAAEFRRFCNGTVPLARLPKRVFTTIETLEAAIEIAHFGAAPLENAVVEWRLEVDGNTAVNGELPARTIAIGNGITVGVIKVDLKDLPTPAKARLVVGIKDTRFQNDWDLWIYPSVLSSAPQETIVCTSDLGEALTALRKGGDVLYLPPPAMLAGEVALGFSPIFWNTACTQGQAPHTLGVLCDPKHAALAAFPTESHGNWQWWHLVSQAGAMVLDTLSPSLTPIVQVIDDWYFNRRLGLLLEARCGAGRLLVCSVNLNKGLESNPVARQFLHSLRSYMAGTHFAPTVIISADELRTLLKTPSVAG